MLDLDQYINNSMKIKLNGKEYDILEPTIGMNMELSRIEADLDENNMHEKRIEAAMMLMNHNRQGKKFSVDELKKVPFEGLTRVLAEIALFRLQADSDPNLESQSQTET